MKRVHLAVLLFALLGTLPSTGEGGDEPAVSAEAERLRRLLDALRADLPRETFDPAAVVARVGKDPAALLAWVRDRTWWVPYRGALRGARGVLADRVGSSLDRALLLAELLRSAGHEVRLAHAALADEQARSLLARVRPAPPLADRLPEARKPSDEEARGVAARLSNAAGLRAEDLGASIRAAVDAGARASEETGARVAKLATALLAAWKPTPPSESAAEDAGADPLRAIADHWWVETGPATDGPETSLDPLLPDAKPGDRHAASTETIPYDGGPDRVPLDASHCHEVIVRVVIEAWKGGRLEEHAVLEHPFRPAERLGLEIVLEHAATRASPPPDGRADYERADKAILAYTEWTPFLRVGDDVVFRSAFKSDGTVRDATGTFGDSGAVAGGGVSDILRGRRLPGGGGAPAAASHLTAEWIEYEIRSPGRPPDTRRREVFDAIGPAVRAAASAGTVPAPDLSERRRLERGLVLLGRVETVLLPCDPSPALFVDRLLAYLIENRAALFALRPPAPGADTRHPVEAQRLAEAVTALLSGPSPAHRVALGRLFWRRGAGADGHVNRPNVIDYRWRVARRPHGEPAVVSEIDVVSNEVAVRQGGAERARFASRAAHGILDTVVEDVAIGAQGTSAADVLEAASAQGVPLLAVTSTGDERLAKTGASADVRARIDADLDAGYAVVLPERALAATGGREGRIAWWRVDPRSGSTVGVLDTGLNGAGTEDPAMRSAGKTLAALSVTELVEAILPYFFRGHPAIPFVLELARRATYAPSAASATGGGPGIEEVLVGIGGVLAALSIWALPLGPPTPAPQPTPPPPGGSPGETPPPPR